MSFRGDLVGLWVLFRRFHCFSWVYVRLVARGGVDVFSCVFVCFRGAFVVYRVFLQVFWVLLSIRGIVDNLGFGLRCVFSCFREVCGWVYGVPR